MKEQMIAYLQEQFTRYLEDAKRYGDEERMVVKEFNALIANKEMAEALIGEPVNLRKSGQVTLGVE